MKIVVVGGTGRAGSRILEHVRTAGHDVRSASRSTGVDTVSGAGVAEALAGQDVVVDATASTGDAMAFFTASTRTLLELGRAAGVRHHVVLSVVGADRMPGSFYMKAKVAQEELVRQSGIAGSIVRATQFHDFIPTLAEVFSSGAEVRVPLADIQPVAVDDVAAVVAEIAAAAPIDGILDVGGPERMTFAQAIARVAPGKRVVMDPAVTYFGASLESDTLIPRAGARLGTLRLGDNR